MLDDRRAVGRGARADRVSDQAFSASLYAARRLYRVFRLTPRISAAFCLLPPQASSVAMISCCSTSLALQPTRTISVVPSSDLPARGGSAAAGARLLPPPRTSGGRH